MSDKHYLTRKDHRGSVGNWIARRHTKGPEYMPLAECKSITPEHVYEVLGVRTVYVYGTRDEWADMVKRFRKWFRNYEANVEINASVGLSDLARKSSVGTDPRFVYQCLDITTEDDPYKMRIMHADLWFGKWAHDLSFKDLVAEVDLFGYIFESVTGRTSPSEKPLYVQSTPATTGAYMFETYLPFDDYYQRIEDDYVVRAIAPPRAGSRDAGYFGADQHRRETYIDDAPGYLEFDRREAYFDMAGFLTTPTGDVVSELGGTFIPYQPAFYKIRARVPDDWSHVGLVQATIKGGRRWANTPGEVFEGWFGEPEAALLIEPKSRTCPPEMMTSWQPQILEKISFENGLRWSTGTKKHCQAFTPMVKRLREIRDDFFMASKVESGVARYATRAILISLIGQLNAAPRSVRVTTEKYEEMLADDQIPEDAIITVRNKGIVEIDGLSKRRGLYYPQISGTLWSKSRAVLTRRMLNVPFYNLVGCNGDAIYAQADIGLYPGTTKEDDYFRLKSSHGNLATKAA